MFYKLLHFGQKKGMLKQIIIRRLIRVLYSCNIDLNAKIDDSVRFSHYALGVTIHPNAVIGKNCQVEVNVVIGETVPGKAPNIGNNVHIGAGAVIIGGIKIGDNVIIGANSVVCKNVDSNCVVAGVPAHVVRRLDEQVDVFRKVDEL